MINLFFFTYVLLPFVILGFKKTHKLKADSASHSDAGDTECNDAAFKGVIDSQHS